MSPKNKSYTLPITTISLCIALLVSVWNISQIHGLERHRIRQSATAKTPVHITPITQMPAWQKVYNEHKEELKLCHLDNEIMKNITKKYIRTIYYPITHLDGGVKLADPRIKMDKYIDATERLSAQDYLAIQQALSKLLDKDCRSIVMNYLLEQHALDDLWIEWALYNESTYVNRFFFIERPEMTISNNTIKSDIAITEHHPLREQGDPSAHTCSKIFSSASLTNTNRILVETLMKYTNTSHIVVDETSTIECPLLLEKFPFIITPNRNNNKKIYVSYDPFEKITRSRLDKTQMGKQIVSLRQENKEHNDYIKQLLATIETLKIHNAHLLGEKIQTENFVQNILCENRSLSAAFTALNHKVTTLQKELEQDIPALDIIEPDTLDKDTAEDSYSNRE